MGQYFNDFQGETTGQQPANTQQEYVSGATLSNAIEVDGALKVLRMSRAASGGASEAHLRFLRFPTNQQQTRALIKFKINSNINFDTGAAGSGNYPFVLYTNASGSTASKTALQWNIWGRGNSNIGRGILDRYLSNAYVWIAQTPEIGLQSGVWYWMRTENIPYSGTAQWNRLRIWQDGTSEPGWQIDFDHSANATSLMNGWFGLAPYNMTTDVSVAQVGLGWGGDQAPVTMPNEYLGSATLSTSNGANLTASGTIVPGGASNYSSAIKQTVQLVSSGYNNIETMTIPSVTAGSFLMLTSKTGTVPHSSVVDSTGQTWVQLIGETGTGNTLNVWYLANANAGTHTLTLNQSNYVVTSAIVREYTGIATTSPIDVYITNPNSGYTQSHSAGPTAITTQKTRVIFVFAGSGDGSPGSTITAGAGYGNLSYRTEGAYSSISVQDKLAPTTGTQSGTISGSAYETGVSAVIAIKDASSVRPAPPGATSQANWYTYGYPAVTPYATRTTYLQNAWIAFRDYCFTQTGMPGGMPVGAWRVSVPDQTDPVSGTANGTFSEGIGYGMLMAVYMGQSTSPVYDSNAKAYFDGFWKYYNHFKNSNGLMNWRISAAGVVTGTGGATDGDLDVAFALLMADKVWRSNGAINYGGEAQTLLAAILSKEFYPVGHALENIMINGDQWDSTFSGNPNHVMPDYFAPGFFTAFATFTGNTRWNTIKAVNYPILIDQYDAAYNTGLLPDHATRQGGAVSGQSYISGYNAMRRWRQVLDYLWNGGATYQSSYWLNTELTQFIQTQSGGLSTATKAEWSIDGATNAGYSNVAHNQAYASATLMHEAFAPFGNTLYSSINSAITTGPNSSIGYFGLGLSAMSTLVASGLMQPTYAGPNITDYGIMSNNGDSDLTVSGSVLATGAMTNNGDSDFTVTGNVIKLGNPNIMSGNSSLINTVIFASAADPSQQLFNDYYPIFNSGGWGRAGQSWTVPGTGTKSINSISLHAATGGATNYTVALRVYTTEANFIANTGHIAETTAFVNSQTYAWYDWVFAVPLSLTGGTTYWLRPMETGIGESVYIHYQNTNVYSGGQAYNIIYGGAGGSGTLAANPTHDMTFKVNMPGGTFVGSFADLEGTSTFTSSGQPVLFGTMSNNGDSNFTASATATFAASMSNNGDSDLTSTGVRIRLGDMTNNGDSDFTVTALAGRFSSMNETADSTLTVTGSRAHYGTSGNNLLPNGNMESDISSWNEYHNPGPTNTILTQDATTGAIGPKSLKMETAASGNSYAGTYVAASGIGNGVNHTISVFAKGQAGGENFNIYIGQADNPSQNFTLTTTWARYSFTYIPQNTNPNIYFRSGTAGAVFWIDGASVESGSIATNEPSGDSDLAASAQRTGVISLNELGDSTLTAIPNASFKVTFTENGNSTFDGTTATRIVLGVMSNDGNSTFDGTAGIRIPLGIMANNGDSNFTAVGNAGFYAQMNYNSISSMTVVGSKIHYGTFDADWSADSEVYPIAGLRIPLGNATLVGGSDAGVDSTGIEITHLAITKSYVYKIYDKDWNYLGIWKDVVSDFGYSQEINSAGSAISVVLARNSDSKIAQYESLGTDDDQAILTDDNNELAAEMETTSSVGPGTDVDLNHNVKIYEFSTDPDQPIDGDLVFTGYISMYSSKYGSSENTAVSIFSYGADLDNWLLTEGNVTRLGYVSQDPSDILKDTLDRFNLAGGIVTYDVGVPGTTETITNLVANPSFETNATGWTVAQGVGGRATDVNGGAVGPYYIYTQSMGGSRIDWTSPNLVSGQPYKFSFYLKRPGAGGVNVSGAHNSVTVFDYYPSVGSTWQRYDVSFTATANAPLYVSFSIIGSDNIVNIDGVMLTKGTELYDYFDGSTTDGVIYTYNWTGTTHGSTSTRVRVLTNIGETITDTGTIVTYAFNLNTELEVVKKLLELSPTDWYFYVDLATNLLHFHPRPSAPSHYFYLGKHILNLDLEKSMEGIINDVVITGGKPTNVVKDNFFDTSGTLLQNHVGELNATWTKHPALNTGSMSIHNNRAYGTSAEEVAYLVSGPTTSNDYTVSADLRVLTVAGDISLIGRADPTALTWYMGRIMPTSGGTAELYKRVNGTWTLIQSKLYPINASTTYHCELKMEGQQISFRIDGSTILDLEDGSITYGTRSGFRHVGANSTTTTGMHFNNFIVKHFGTSGVPIFRRYVDNDSIASYRRGLTRIQDNRIEVLDAARLIAESQILRNKEPRYRSNITISGNTYDIRSIKLGDLIGFRNFDNFIDDPVKPVRMQVVRIDYNGDEAKLQLDTLLPSVPKRLEDIKRNLNQEQVGDVGDEPITELT